ncbi:hypothetical protein [Pedobacter xixiisoli]|uniref:CarboxypepD_reg-like domain-containing protein n=1 Tax=Pedobacter xixiisoli TaxID=1476464 RepID=A0A286ADA3_9SPHI|nr:hypothetical protein [Pedobacter xixiisoli]SOD19881.1 hypothetical protein SAMN06297358_3588 [Pedobacter xixiisoli]
MAKNFILFLLLSCLFVLDIFGQIKIIDAIELSPIPSVNVFDEHGKLLGISNADGEILFEGLNNGQQLHLQHISYSPQKVLYYPKTTIRLSNRILPLAEVEITARPKEYDYLVLRGYFRTYQGYNGEPKYFADGIIDYYIPKNKKDKVSYELVEYRVFGNKKLIKQQKLSSSFFNEPPRIPSLRKENLIQTGNSDYVLKKVSEGETEIQKRGIAVGYMRFVPQRQLTEIFIDKIAPDSARTKKILWLTVKATRNEKLEIYNTLKQEGHKMENLMSFYENSAGEYRTKKTADYKKLEFLNEFYVTAKTFVDKKQLSQKKDLKHGIFLDEKSSYHSAYWKNLSNWNIPSLNNGIEKALQDILELY